MPSLAQMPRELLLIIARFVPATMPAVMSADRALWARCSHDELLWTEMVMWMQRTSAGRARLRQPAPRLVARCPALHRVLAVVVHEDGVVFCVSADGRYVACGVVGKTFYVLEGEAHRVVVTLDLQDLDEDVYRTCFSPSDRLLACMDEHRHVRLSCDVRVM